VPYEPRPGKQVGIKWPQKKNIRQRKRKSWTQEEVNEKKHADKDKKNREREGQRERRERRGERRENNHWSTRQQDQGQIFRQREENQHTKHNGFHDSREAFLRVKLYGLRVKARAERYVVVEFGLWKSGLCKGSQELNVFILKTVQNEMNTQNHEAGPIHSTNHKTQSMASALVSSMNGFHDISTMLPILLGAGKPICFDASRHFVPIKHQTLDTREQAGIISLVMHHASGPLLVELTKKINR
jgi:hypothetical protein